ncbi:hypothetical protein [Reyranella sp. CPCC 100927]|uniref:hypothetical protein n=1 Tax=Reyranella sp. CPCC 100927 TaxID=2599616 RepID=UPI0011B3B5CD|nr:hypothetical protein [Reyranella sp. CPCC 100927]TWT13613.1 hypothetical protein FQU96_06735 [Reyranella sp. CPCC 100927]
MRAWWAKSVILAAVAALSCARTASADERQWIGTANVGSVVLAYGTPDSDDMAISFSCDPATKALTVSVIVEPADAKDGMRVDVVLASESGQVVLNATGERLAMDDSFMLHATTRLDPSLRRILTEGRTLTIRVPGSTDRIPLAGAREQAQKLIDACA